MRISGPLIATVLFAAVAAPAFATGVIHSANTEMGYTVHPEHAQPAAPAPDMAAEIAQARRDGTWDSYRLGVPRQVKAGTPLTRAQVEADLLRAQKHPTWSARRVGAPVSMD